jgi:hypothetical protein
MNEEQRIAHLENLLAGFLKPIKGIPFPIVIRAICERSVENVDLSNLDDKLLVESLAKAASAVAEAVALAPIRRPRPNEVGNDLEPFVMEATKQSGLISEAPRSASGRGQQVGYPDILVYDHLGRPTYLEVKSYAYDTEPNTMRSFYLSPSANPKVCLDARHLVLGFGMKATQIDGSRDSLYTVSSYKLINLFELECDVKYEFNSDNRRMYHDSLLLASATFN